MQCDSRDEEFEARENEWVDKLASMRAQRDETRLENISLKGQLKALPASENCHIDFSASEEGRDHCNQEVDSPVSSVCGFSEYSNDDQDRAGRRYIASMKGLPEKCSISMIYQLLSDFEVDREEVNFIGVKNTGAAIFVNTRQTSNDLVSACHLRVVRGGFIRCRASSSGDMDSCSSLPNDVAPGDMVEIYRLITETGIELNGLHGKVLAFDNAKGCFAVKIREEGKTLLMKPENVELAMEAEEMSSSAEDFFMDLRP